MLAAPDNPEQAKKRTRIPWDKLSADEQLRLRVDYGRYLDQLPPTCSLEEKNARFARWLVVRGVLFSP